MPSKEFDRSLAGMASLGLEKVKRIASVGIYSKCGECGNPKPMFGGGPCPHTHMLGDEEEKIFVNFVSGSAPKPGPSLVEKVKSVFSSSPKEPEPLPEPVKEESEPVKEPTPEEVEAARIKARNDLIREHDPNALLGAPKRKTVGEGSWGISTKEMYERIDAAENRTIRRDDDDDLPTYMI